MIMMMMRVEGVMSLPYELCKRTHDGEDFGEYGRRFREGKGGYLSEWLIGLVDR